MGRVYDCRPNRKNGENAARGLMVEAIGENSRWHRLRLVVRVEFDEDTDTGLATVTGYAMGLEGEPLPLADPSKPGSIARYTLRCYARVRPRGGNEATVIGTAGEDPVGTFQTVTLESRPLLGVVCTSEMFTAPDGISVCIGPPPAPQEVPRNHSQVVPVADDEIKPDFEVKGSL